MVQCVTSMLSKNTNSKFSMDEAIAIENWDLIDHCLYKGRFSSSVWSNQSNSGLHINIYIDFCQQRNILRPTASGFIESQDWRRNLFRVREHKDARRIIYDLVNKLNTIDSLDSRLSLCGSLGVVSEFVDKLLHVGDLCFLTLSHPSLLFRLLILRFFELIEITSVISELLTLEIDNFINDLIEKIPGMRYDQDSDIKIFNILFKPN